MEDKNEIHIYRHIIAAFFFGLLLAVIFAYPIVILLDKAFGAGYCDSIVKEGWAVSWGKIAAYVAALLVWFRPLALYLSGKRNDLHGKAVERFNSTYRAFICVAAALLADAVLSGLFFGIGLQPVWGWRDFVFGMLAPTAFTVYYFVYFSILYLEPVTFERVALRLYDKEKIFGRKKGLGLSVRARLWLMIVNLAVIPMALVAANILSMDAPGLQKEKIALFSIILLSLACIAGYSEMIYRGITKPLAELVKKMGRLAEGDFDVRTTVLADDEIGTVKAHFNDMVAGMEERERLKETFGKYLSVEIARQLMASGKIKLGGDSIKATILFSDIRDFTPLSENMPAGALVQFLNSYFSHIVEPITANRGVVNKFIGDAVMAIFAPQFGSENHVEDAMHAAIGMRAKLEEFNRKRLIAQEVRSGIGLHTGVLVAGNIGTEQRMEYTVIGDTVNIASRIESMNKNLGSTILISQDVHTQLGEELKKNMVFRPCEDVVLKGKKKTMTLYQVE